MGVVERLQTVRANIATAISDAKRDADTVKLIAVSKTHPVPSILAANGADQLHFGESRAKEMRDKAAELQDVHWHFIGRLQSNKAKFIAPVAYRIHALESLRQAEALAKRTTTPLKCLIAVNIANEPQKGGVSPESALDMCRLIAQQGVVELCGLMCIPPRNEDANASAPFYEELAHLASVGRADGLPLHELSMGMSNDYAVAVAHGATWLRVGTAIFGTR